MFKRFLLTITALSLMFCLLSCGDKTDNNSNNLKQELERLLENYDKDELMQELERLLENSYKDELNQELEKLLENSDKDQIIEKADRENLGYEFDGETVFREDNYIGN